MFVNLSQYDLSNSVEGEITPRRLIWNFLHGKYCTQQQVRP